MRMMIFAGVASLAFAAPLVAQDVDADVDADVEADIDAMDADADIVLTSDQQVMYDAWPTDRRAMYDAWPADVRTYYWTLTPAQAEGWWMLTDEQRLRIYAMTPAQRTAAWTSVAAQMGGAPTSATAVARSRSMPAGTNIRFVSTAMVQPIPEDQPASTGEDLPVCTPNQQDGCINSWEKNRTGTRPLEYWPGRPASEIGTPLPAEDPDE